MDRPEFGIVGYGRFGKFIAQHLAGIGSVVVTDRRWERPREGLAAEAVRDPEPGALAPSPKEAVSAGTLADTASARVVILAVPIRALPEVLDALSPLLGPRTLVADTASVKVWPSRWMLERLPPEVDIAATHPLFGPDSAAASLAEQKLVLCPLRLRHARSVRRFLENLGLRVIDATPEEHDREMAATQALTHWIGRGLERIGASPRELDTTGYRRLLEILGYVTRDSAELFLDLQRWNPYAAKMRLDFLRVLHGIEEEIQARDERGDA